MRRARVALAAAAAGVLLCPGLVALRVVPVVDAAAPPPSVSGPVTRSAVVADATDDPVMGPHDDLRPGGLRMSAAATVRTTTAQAATVRAALGPVQRPPATPLAGRAVEATGVQAVLAAAYERAARSVPLSCHLRPEYLAAIGQIESGSLGGRRLVGHQVVPAVLGPLLDGGPFAVVRDTDGGRYDGSAQYDRAVGPMQFLPGTWAWAGRDGDGDGVRDPQNVFDASYAAAAYLCRGGRDLAQAPELRAAFWSYNQSGDYVSAALAWVSYFERNGLGALGAVDVTVASGGRASDLGPRAAAAPAAASPMTPAAASHPSPAKDATTAPTTTPTTTAPTTAPTTPTTTAPTEAPTPASPTTTTAPTSSPTTSPPTSPVATTPTETPTPTTTTSTPTAATATATPTATATATASDTAASSATTTASTTP